VKEVDPGRSRTPAEERPWAHLVGFGLHAGPLQSEPGGGGGGGEQITFFSPLTKMVSQAALAVSLATIRPPRAIIERKVRSISMLPARDVLGSAELRSAENNRL
jgi:hypothetical protein